MFPLQVEEVTDMLSGVPIEIPPKLDLRDVTPDELVRLPQSLGVCDNSPLRNS